MAIPNATGLTTENLDQATDNPSKARSDLALLMQKVRELLESVDQADGIVKLDTDAQIEIAKLFTTGGGLKIVKKAGTGNVLSHTNAPETAADIATAKGEAIKRVKIDASGHVVRVEKGDVSTLTGPFYSKWFYYRYETLSETTTTKYRADYDPDILSFISGFNERLPTVTDYIKTLGAGNFLSAVEERALAEVKNAVFEKSTSTAPLQGTVTTFYVRKIKPFRARFAYYTLS